ncbi:MAG TPA: kelch repeat-containing protein [Acidimicrobiales bacterium]|nr:kelch repeat-containing protein [Acidimicrobiales bacterium]
MSRHVTASGAAETRRVIVRRRVGCILAAVAAVAATVAVNVPVRGTTPGPTQPGIWKTTESLDLPRPGHTATVLTGDAWSCPIYCGRLLMAGGSDASGQPSSGGSLFDPATGTWSGFSVPGATREGRSNHTATRIADGALLLAGGNAAVFMAGEDSASSAPTATAEILRINQSGNPSSTKTGSLNEARAGHTATLLPDGKVLVVGGISAAGTPLASAEIFDPAAPGVTQELPVDPGGGFGVVEVVPQGKWTVTSSPMASARSGHTATLIPTAGTAGKVLIVGGDAAGSAEVFDVATSAWSTAGSLSPARTAVSATLLDDGSVLVAGGRTDSGPVGVAETYNPASGLWSTVDSLETARADHLAVALADGRVLVAGGGPAGSPLASVEVYAPASSTWSEARPMITARRLGDSSLTLLPDGTFLAAGALGRTEIYDPGAPAVGHWSGTGYLSEPRLGYSATVLADGKLLVAGGATPSSSKQGLATRSAEVYDPDRGTWVSTSGPMTLPRIDHTATLLSGPACAGSSPPGYCGKVLVTGGAPASDPAWTQGTQTAELYDPATATWALAAPMAVRRTRHAALRLADGKVLVVGGSGVSDAELYDPGTGEWFGAGDMGVIREADTRGQIKEILATQLGDGRVMVVGGDLAVADKNKISVYASGTWSVIEYESKGNGASATFLADGRLFLAGGSGVEATRAKLYDPTSGAWTASEEMIGTGRGDHMATLLKDGRVLIAGGRDLNSSNTPKPLLRSTEIYDPSADRWSETGSLGTVRQRSRSDDFAMSRLTLLRDGTALILGGMAINSFTRTLQVTGAVNERYPPAPARVAGALPPGRPGSVTATAGNASAMVSWEAPASDGGAPILSYTVTGTPGGATTTVAGTARQAVLGGLVNGSSYTFTVVATNANGTSPLSLPSDWVTPRAEVLGPPTDVVATAGNASATVSWLAPADQGELGISGYVVTAAPGSATARVSGNLRSARLSLVNGTTYTFTVRANRGVNDDTLGMPSEPSNSVTPSADIPPDPTEPSAPTTVKATPGAGSATVEWAAPALDGGRPVTAYWVSASPGGATVSVGAPARSATVSGLVNGTKYTFAVWAVNEIGPGPASDPSNAVTPLASHAVRAPGFPTAVGATPGERSAIVTWARPAAEGGSPVSSFVVTARPGGETATAAGDASSVTFGGLDNGTAYTFTVRAVNAAGQGPRSAPSNQVIPPTGVGGGGSAAALSTGSSSASTCSPLPAPAAGQLVYLAGYSIVGLPGGTSTGARSPLYGWWDKGTGGTYDMTDPSTPVTAGRGYWAWAPCARLVDLPSVGASSATASSSLGAYRASLVGNPSASAPATVSGHEFMARWDPTLNGGAGGYQMSRVGEASTLAVGEGAWVFSYLATTVTVSEQ